MVNIRIKGSQFNISIAPPLAIHWMIIIKNPNTKSSLRYCLIEFGYKGITCYGSSPDIIDCEIQFNHHSGISCEVRSKPIVARNVIFGNGFAGINCELASMPIVSQCTISQNNFGIVVFSKSAPDIGRYPKVEGSSIGENKIFNNFEYNVYNHSTSILYAQNNYWNITSRADIQQALFDKNNNPSYGEVIFMPIYRQPRRQRQIPAVIVLKDDNLK